MCAGITIMIIIGIAFLIPAMMMKKEGFYLITPPPPRVVRHPCGKSVVVKTDIHGMEYREVDYDSGASFPAVIRTMEDNF